MANEKGIIIFVVIAIIAIMFMTQRQGEFVRDEIEMVQYAGTLNPTFATWYAGYAFPIAQSDTATVFNYEIVTQRTVGDASLVCKENTCNGEPTSQDARGCTIWQGTEPQPYCPSGTMYTGGDCTNDIGVGSPCCGKKERKCTGYYYSQSCWDDLVSAGSIAYRDIPATCGGADESAPVGEEACLGRFQVFKDGNKVYDSEAFTADQKNFNDGILRVTFNTGSQYTSGQCLWIENEIRYKIPKTVLLVFEPIEGTYEYQSDVTKHITIDNTEGDPMPLRISTNTGINEYTLPTGVTEYDYQVPTNALGNTTVSTNIAFIVEGSNFAGVNGRCASGGGVRDLSTCQEVYAWIYNQKDKISVLTETQYISTTETVTTTIEGEVPDLEGSNITGSAEREGGAITGNLTGEGISLEEFQGTDSLDSSSGFVSEADKFSPDLPRFQTDEPPEYVVSFEEEVQPNYYLWAGILLGGFIIYQVQKRNKRSKRRKIRR